MSIIIRPLNLVKGMIDPYIQRICQGSPDQTDQVGQGRDLRRVLEYARLLKTASINITAKGNDEIETGHRPLSLCLQKNHLVGHKN